MAKPLVGKVALVTGASRGIGRGIALQLGEAGATVYVTGRKPETSLAHEYNQLPSLEKTAEDIRSRGGDCVPVYCDHSDPSAVASLFDRIDNEKGGQLDILVNNAYSAVLDLANSGSVKFFDLDPLFWDSCNNVGLRNHYICCVHASRMMVKRNCGLIVNISSAGALQYTFNVAYGVGKAAMDRMTADMAVELKPSKVTIVSLWPGVVRSEMAAEMHKQGKVEKMIQRSKEVVDKSMATGESPEFVGKAVVALATDQKINRKSGKVMLSTDVAHEYGFKDIDGSTPMDIRQVSVALEYFGWNRLSRCFPSFVRIPLQAMHFASYKF